MPIDGKRSTEQARAATSTTVVIREPAAPSTRSCDALRSAAAQAVPPATAEGAAVAGAMVGASGEEVGAVVGTTVGAGTVGAVEAASDDADGVPEQATRPRASRPA